MNVPSASPAPQRPMIQPSLRAQAVQPFYVMEMAKEAARIAQSVPDPRMIYLNIGEPDFGAAPAVLAAAQAVLDVPKQPYTAATGIPDLRLKLSKWYKTTQQLDIAPERILITAGASAGLMLTCLALLNAGDEVLMPDPCYPCNRQFVQMADANAVCLDSGPAQRFQLSSKQVADHWGANTKAVMLASPANPTGTSIAPDELARIVQFVRSQGGITVVDEIYLPLSFDARFAQSALHLGDDIISINSFSKYFGMTGWRLGWLVVPTHLAPTLEAMAQHLYISPSYLSQRSALACFEADSIAQYEHRRTLLQARRDRIVPALQVIGLDVPVLPDGAFYVWMDASNWLARTGFDSTWDLAFDILRQSHVVITPGRDFGSAQTSHYLRLSIASSDADLDEAVQRLATYIQNF